MENIFLPSKLDFAAGENANQSVLTIEPLWHGYGTTLGNALRRVLLSSLPGAAVSAVKIKGANHEFQSLNGIMEDVLEITLNLKQLRLKMHTDEAVKLTLKKKGAGEVTAKDFDKNSDIEVMNPDLHIAEISTKAGELEMEITVTKGMGFEPKEARGKNDKEVGLIEIDAIFTPIKHVGFHVEDTRVGQITNYDKLTMTIETDGTLTPQEAIEESSKILINHFNLLAGGEIPAIELEVTEESSSTEENEA